jgi:hypothetical protein
MRVPFENSRCRAPPPRCPKKDSYITGVLGQHVEWSPLLSALDPVRGPA